MSITNNSVVSEEDVKKAESLKEEANGYFKSEF